MIDLEKLKNVKRLVTHANCPDGVASALIVKDALPDVEVTFMAHGTEEHVMLEPEPGMLFCDFTPYIGKPGQAGYMIEAWLMSGAIVLDHHPTQRELMMKFVEAGLGAYGENDKNECGAWLAYEHVWLPLRGRGYDEEERFREQSVQDFARLAGIRDTWKKDDPRWQQACEQAENLMFWPFEMLNIEDAIAREATSFGKVLFEKKLELARKAIGEAHSFTSQRGTRVLMFQGVTPTSDAAEILEKAAIRDVARGQALTARSVDQETIDRYVELQQPSIVAGFHYKVDAGKLKLQFSTRSHTGYDVGAFCKSRGGGGHKAAAGFTVEQSAEVGANPYAVLKLLLEEWEQGQ